MRTASGATRSRFFFRTSRNKSMSRVLYAAELFWRRDSWRSTPPATPVPARSLDIPLRKSEHTVMPRHLLAAMRTLLLLPLFLLAALPAPAADVPGDAPKGPAPAADAQPPLRRLLYVAVPGIRDYLEY